jgi:hypothetical protein
MTAALSCRFCAAGTPDGSSGDRVLYRYPEWTVGTIPERNVPGWILVWGNRHTVGLASMSRSEAAGFGGVLAAVGAAITEVVRPVRVYFISLGENYEHLHGILLARPAGLTKEQAGARLLHDCDRFRDSSAAGQAADEIAARLRSWSEAS